MIISILSGKGGTGKTLLSVNLSYLLNGSTYIDCDVEEPNGFIYFKPNHIVKHEVSNLVPIINYDKCLGCRKCVEFCKFNALVMIKGKIKVYQDLCHSCGGCKLVCPEDAIDEVNHCIGYVKKGISNEKTVFAGELIVGEESGVPIIKELLNEIKDNEIVFVDSPPGNGCTVMESITDADYCILVSEPSIFGLHNLKMVYELTKVFNKPVGLVINKATDNKIINDFASINNIKILGEIPMDLELGKQNSNGEIVSKNIEFRPLFQEILDSVLKEVSS